MKRPTPDMLPPKPMDMFRQRVERDFPGAQIEVDNEGQLVIYTGLRLTADERIEEMQ